MLFRTVRTRETMLRAILFDLDDTLFDHRHCAREALTAVHQAHTCFAAVAFDEFERAHAEHLEALHLEVLDGRLSIDAARAERFHRLLAAAGGAIGDARRAAATFRERYVSARRPVPGAQALLAALQPHARLAIVSNNLLAEQQEKLRECGLDAYVDALIVSEEAGASKPDPGIFRIALERVEASPAEALMIGDSWANDIEGARALGLPAIWFNPGGLPPPDPSAGVPELRTLEPAADVASTIRSIHSRAHRD
jgi:putative hydrolase of the HAD superfamily